MAKNILLINGPNLNLLGTRESEIYGLTSLSEIERITSAQAKASGVKFKHFQSNCEGELINRIHLAQREGVDAIVVNAGSFTHTSLALRDALAGVAIRFIEVHISNVYQRETFRHYSYLSNIAVGVICGLGIDSYSVAVDFAIRKL
jgi:3-dehydroquinate dehydratase-2